MFDLNLGVNMFGGIDYEDMFSGTFDRPVPVELNFLLDVNNKYLTDENDNYLIARQGGGPVDLGRRIDG